MLVSYSDFLYQSSLLQQIPNIRHGFTTRLSGDLSTFPAAQSYLIRSGFHQGYCVLPRQVHGNTVKRITEKKECHIVENADGLISVASCRDLLPILAVRTADCVPILFVDSVRAICAAVHAGWRGTLGRIAQKTVEYMYSLGSHPRDIIVAFGPSIGVCCYAVSDERAFLFEKEFGYDPTMITYRAHQQFIDLHYVNKTQLCRVGVLEHHIDDHPPCTSCKNDVFFSYRKDRTDMKGESLNYVTISEI